MWLESRFSRRFAPTPAKAGTPVHPPIELWRNTCGSLQLNSGVAELVRVQIFRSLTTSATTQFSCNVPLAHDQVSEACGGVPRSRFGLCTGGSRRLSPGRLRGSTCQIGGVLSQILNSQFSMLVVILDVGSVLCEGPGSPRPF